MTDTTVITIELLGIKAIALSHTRLQIRISRLDEEVTVMVHQAVSMTDPLSFSTQFANRFRNCCLSSSRYRDN